MTPSMSHVVIVGAGQAGFRAAERLRELDFMGKITIVGDEPRRPYNRTPMSKQLLTGHLDVTDLRLPAWRELGISWRLGTRARSLDLDARTVRLAGGEKLGYDGLILAGGVQARHLPGTPMHSEHVWMLRTLDDCRAIDHLLERAGHVAVIGGGFIGCELASTCRERVLDVTIIDVSPTNGERIDADMAVVGIGTTADTDWLESTGLDVSNGILCTPTCHVAGATDIVACGDVARWPNLRFDATPRRIEHWLNAIEMGQHAATSLLLGADHAQPFTPIPRFWSQQHGHRIQSVGMPELGHMTIAEGSTASRQFVATFDHDGRTVGAIAMNSPRRKIHYSELIDQDCPIDHALAA